MPLPLRQRVHPGVTLWWEQAPRVDMAAEAQAALPHETGGLLLGWTSTSDIVITHTIGPGPGAEHQPTGFTPDRDWQYAQIDELYAESGRTLQYLGDWHTHPDGLPRPSALDVSLLRKIATTPESRCPRPVMGILANNANGIWSAAFHLYEPASRRGSRISMLTVKVI